MQSQGDSPPSPDSARNPWWLRPFFGTTPALPTDALGEVEFTIDWPNLPSEARTILLKRFTQDRRLRGHNAGNMLLTMLSCSPIQRSEARVRMIVHCMTAIGINTHRRLRKHEIMTMPNKRVEAQPRRSPSASTKRKPSTTMTGLPERATLSRPKVTS